MRVSGECRKCAGPIVFDLPGHADQTVPLTGDSPMHKGCAYREGFDSESETLEVFHREPKHVVRTFRKGRSMDLQILDHISSGVPFDDKKPRDDAQKHGRRRNRMGRYRHRYVEDPKLVATLAAPMGLDTDAAVAEAVKLIRAAEHACAGLRAERLRADALGEKPPLDLGELRARARAFFENDVLGVHGAGPLAELIEQAQDKSDPDRQVETLGLLLLVAGSIQSKSARQEA